MTVRLFAVARERAGASTLALTLDAPATVADLRRALADACPPLAPILPGARIAVGAEYAEDDWPVPPGADLAVIPPVSGGQPDPTTPP